MEAIALCYLLNKLKPSRCVTYWTNWSHPAVLLIEQTEAIQLCYLLNKLKPSSCVTYWTNWSHPAVLLTEQTEAIPLCYLLNWSHPAVLLSKLKPSSCVTYSTNYTYVKPHLQWIFVMFAVVNVDYLVGFVWKLCGRTTRLYGAKTHSHNSVFSYLCRFQQQVLQHSKVDVFQQGCLHVTSSLPQPL